MAGWEIRWFGAGTLPDDVAPVFSSLPHRGEKVAHETRTDSYVVLSNQDDMGIKIRGTDSGSGKFEIKARQGCKDIEIAGRVSGVAERWRKVSWEYEDDDRVVVDAFIHQALGGHLVDVRKDRWQWKFEPDEAELTPLVFAERPLRACLLEHTTLELGGESFWTIALDAFDQRSIEGALEALEMGCQLALGAYKGSNLDAASSFGYPTQLIRIGRDSRKS